MGKTQSVIDSILNRVPDVISAEHEFSSDEKAFRDDVRNFLKDAFTPDLQAAAARQAGVFAEPELGIAWQRRLYERGWGAPNWPKQWGGAEFSPMQRYIFSVECANAGTPVVAGMGLLMCGPVLMKFGTAEQKERFLPHIPPMDHYWCQGFSEPGAGSDLSALRCHAARDGDEYIVNGSKIWTTHAHAANWIFLLVRTSLEGVSQAGITFLLSPMDAPGITVRPIRSMSGEHEVNEVFFDNVRIPTSLRVGEEHRGWDVAKFLLMHERGGTSAAAALKNALRRTRLVAAAEVDEEGRPFIANPSFRSRLAALEIEIAAIEAAEMRNLGQGALVGAAGMANASMQKLKVSTVLQRLAEMSVEALGVSSMRDYRTELYGDTVPQCPDLRETAVARHLNVRAATIFGGASEIQKGIVARSALGI